jgi:hypothetical protein
MFSFAVEKIQVFLPVVGFRGLMFGIEDSG